MSLGAPRASSARGVARARRLWKRSRAAGSARLRLSARAGDVDVAAAMAHARWYIDSADIRLDWFQGTYPEGEAAIREGMAALQGAYLRLAEE